MHPVISKTLGGLSASHYFRHFIFGLIFAIPLIYAATNSDKPLSFPLVAFVIINTLLYPYSRFVYESVVNFIVGENVFFMNAMFMLVVKVMTMALCWCFSIFVAPIGLAYLYYYHSKTQPQ